MSAITPRRANGRAPRAVTPVPATEQRSALMAALLAVQAEAPKLAPNADGQIQSRFYRYVTLDAVVDAVLPLLVKHELTWATFPTSDALGAPALRYKIHHGPSGEEEEDVMPLMCARPDPQGQGSALSYARRYALVAVLNLTTGDDDDGAAASHSTPTGREPVDRYAQAEAAHAQAPVQPTAAPPKPSERAANAKQHTMLETRARAAGLSAGELANVILEAAGEQPRTWRSEEHASQTLGRLMGHLPAGLVTAVKAGIDQAQVTKTAGSGQR